MRTKLLAVVLALFGFESSHTFGVEISRTPRVIKGTPLVLNVAPAELLSEWAPNEASSRLFKLASAITEYDCSISEQCLNAALEKVTIDATFQDVLVQIPVRGSSQTQGSIGMDFVPWADGICVDVHFEGSVTMSAVGHMRRVRIESDITTAFHAIKRLFFQTSAIRAEAARSRTWSSMSVRNVTSTRPVFGRFVERVGIRRASALTPAAERECSTHVRFAIEQYMNEELDRLVRGLNTSLKKHFVSLSKDERERWHRIQLSSQDTFCRVTRGPCCKLQQLAGHAIMISLPRTNMASNLLVMLSLANIGHIQATKEVTSVGETGASLLSRIRPKMISDGEYLKIVLDPFAEEIRRFDARINMAANRPR